MCIVAKLNTCGRKSSRQLRLAIAGCRFFASIRGKYLIYTLDEHVPVEAQHADSERLQNVESLRGDDVGREEREG